MSKPAKKQAHRAVSWVVPKAARNVSRSRYQRAHTNHAGKLSLGLDVRFHDTVNRLIAMEDGVQPKFELLEVISSHTDYQQLQQCQSTAADNE